MTVFAFKGSAWISCGLWLKKRTSLPDLDGYVEFVPVDPTAIAAAPPLPDFLFAAAVKSPATSVSDEA